MFLRYRIIFIICEGVNIPMKIGYLGPRGTFSQGAAEIYARGIDAELIMYPSIPELIAAAKEKNIDEAVVPLENSIEGSVNVTLDMLAWDVDLKIKREINIPIKHNLMVREGHKNITGILSHPQAIGQCRKFLNSNYPEAAVEYTYSTAQAAEFVASSGREIAAIAAEKAAHEYGLNIINASIEDNGNNVTRFIVLSDHDIDYKGISEGVRTSVVFSTDDKPGSLYRVLQILNLWDINMTKIESRPAKDLLGKYIFFVDIEGHREKEDIKDAITMIKKKTSFFKMLGSYSPIL